MSFLNEGGEPWGGVYREGAGVLGLGINMEVVDFEAHDVRRNLFAYVDKYNLYTNNTIVLTIRGTGEPSFRFDNAKMLALKRTFPFLHQTNLVDAKFPQWTGIMKNPYVDDALMGVLQEHQAQMLNLVQHSISRANTEEFEPVGTYVENPHDPLSVVPLQIPAIDGVLYYD